jgi:predicted component of type VI protein secretion system
MGQAQFQVQTGELAGRVFELPEGQAVTVGRHRNNAIALPDEHASRFHALVIHDRGRWLLSNIGAPINGTRIDGVLLTEQTELRDGQEVAVGDTRLRFALGSALRGGGGSGPPTPLEADELAALCEFMARSLEEADVRTLVRHALETVQRVTRATVTGFLNLDPDDPLLKVVWPERGQVDVQLSRHLNQRAPASPRRPARVCSRTATPFAFLCGQRTGNPSAPCTPTAIRACSTSGTGASARRSAATWPTSCTSRGRGER